MILNNEKEGPKNVDKTENLTKNQLKPKVHSITSTDNKFHVGKNEELKSPKVESVKKEVLRIEKKIEGYEARPTTGKLGKVNTEAQKNTTKLQSNENNPKTIKKSTNNNSYASNSKLHIEKIEKSLSKSGHLKAPPIKLKPGKGKHIQQHAQDSKKTGKEEKEIIQREIHDVVPDLMSGSKKNVRTRSKSSPVTIVNQTSENKRTRTYSEKEIEAAKTHLEYRTYVAGAQKNKQLAINH